MGGSSCISCVGCANKKSKNKILHEPTSGEDTEREDRKGGKKTMSILDMEKLKADDE